MIRKKMLASTQHQKHKETNREKKGGERPLQENLKTIHWIVSWEFLHHDLVSKSFIFCQIHGKLRISLSPYYLHQSRHVDQAQAPWSLCGNSAPRGSRFLMIEKLTPKMSGLWWHWISLNCSFSFHSSPVVTNRRRWTFRKVSSVRCHTHLDWDWFKCCKVRRLFRLVCVRNEVPLFLFVLFSTWSFSDSHLVIKINGVRNHFLESRETPLPPYIIP